MLNFRDFWKLKKNKNETETYNKDSNTVLGSFETQ